MCLILPDRPSVLERFGSELREDIWDDEGWFGDWPEDLVDEDEELFRLKAYPDASACQAWSGGSDSPA